MATYRAKYSKEERRVFAEKLRRLILEKGMQGAELARKASKYREGEMPRQLISQYLNGTTIPDEVNLRALEKALDCPTDYLLPRPHKMAPGEIDKAPPKTEQDLRVRVVEGGMMEISFSGTVPRDIGWQIMTLLEKSGH
ncbi:MAG: helix-turn-helix domain-containing protein [Solirubrobacteraceae bacterium]